MALVEVSDFSFAYPADGDVRRGDSGDCVLDGVSFEVNEGDFCVLVGSTGSGKTTLLNLIGGMEHPTSGSVEVGGVDVCSADDETLSGIRRRKLGYIFQDFNLIPILTAEENIIMPLLLAVNRRGNRAFGDA